MVIVVRDWIVSPYAVCMLTALAAGFVTAYILLRKEHIEIRIAGLSVFMNLVFVLFMGKVYTLIISANQDNNLWNVSFSSVGGAIGMLAGIEIFNWIYKERQEVFRQIYVLIIPMLYSVSKVGCFLVGCCYGIPYQGVGHICYVVDVTNPDSDISKVLLQNVPKGNVIPVQLIESIVFAVIFLFFMYRYLKNKRTYFIEKIAILSSLCKFLLEYIRADNIGSIINANQIVCLVIIAFMIIRILNIKGKKNG